MTGTERTRIHQNQCEVLSAPSDWGMLPPTPRCLNPYYTISYLSVRYPGVKFIGDESSSAFIDAEARISAGAEIHLDAGVQIQGSSVVGSNVVILGGIIKDTRIEGESIVVGGLIVDGRMRGGKVSGGTLVETVQSGGEITGGTLTECLVYGGIVRGGDLRHCRVEEGAEVTTDARRMLYATISRNFDPGSSSRESSEDASVSPLLSSGPSTQQLQNHRPSIRACPDIDRAARFDAEPPEEYCDFVLSKDLIHIAVITPNGDTYDRLDIEKWISFSGSCPVTRTALCVTDLRPNRALQIQIDRWKSQHIIRDGD